MTLRMRITKEPELLQRARARARDLDVSFAEYVRRLIARDLGKPEGTADPSNLFDLGNSRIVDIAKDKDSLIGEAIAGQRTARVGRP